MTDIDITTIRQMYEHRMERMRKYGIKPNFTTLAMGHLLGMVDELAGVHEGPYKCAQCPVSNMFCDQHSPLGCSSTRILWANEQAKATLQDSKTVGEATDV